MEASCSSPTYETYDLSLKTNVTRVNVPRSVGGHCCARNAVHVAYVIMISRMISSRYVETKQPTHMPKFVEQTTSLVPACS